MPASCQSFQNGMRRSQHAIFQDVLRRTYDRVPQRDIVLIIAAIEFANIPMIRIEILNSLSSETDPLITTPLDFS